MAARGIAVGEGSPGPLVLSVISPEERAGRAALEKAEADRRLLEAETRLREALQELHNSKGDSSSFSNLFSGRHCLCKHGDSCVANAVGSLCQSFMLAYGVRVGIGVLLRAFKLARRQPFGSFLNLKLLLSEKDLIIREEACRTGLLFGGFTGCFHAVRCILRRKLGKEAPVSAFIAGTVAGLSVLSLDDYQRRRTLALYLLARVAQCTYNSAKAKKKFHFWGSHWQHGDTLLFALASAQNMYAYVMRPETLPNSYLEFISKSGPMAKEPLEAVRESIRGGGVNIESLSKFMFKKTGRPLSGLQSNVGIIPCSVLHPQTTSCLAHNAKASRATFKKTFPLYLSLTFVPYVVLNVQKFMRAPIYTCWIALRGAVRSTCFLSTFVGIYMGCICVHRKIMAKDNKLVYYMSGAVAALSALLEKKSRRSELALYTLPRAADSLWYTLVNRQFLPDVKHAEVALFCLCMGGMMYFHEYEPTTMAPFLRGLLTRFLNRTGTPDQGANRVASYTQLQPLISSMPVDQKSFSTSSSRLSNPEDRSSTFLSDTADKLKTEAFQGL